MLDTSYRVEIPGGINLEAQVVGPIPRCLAFAIDLGIRGIIVFIMSLLSIPFGSFGMGGGFFLIFLFVIEWLYPVLFEVLARGQTPGKKLLKISVINDDLSPVTLGTSMVRNLLRTVDFLPLFYLAGLVTMLSNQRFQRLGDLAAGTLVISVPESSKPATVKEIVPLAPPTPLLRTEQSSIIEFMQRTNQLSEPRQRELANILEGVTHEKGDDGVERLQRIGAWFLGVR
ncbi:MAG: RDD family protein [Gammaproteobacteria bacterium]|nr:RDD family protein [Gammaproteobacteria bacterium]MDH3858443.1 RDD family protein [Gammaproteobacteria bacterium]